MVNRRIPPLMIDYPVELIDLSEENLRRPSHLRRLSFIQHRTLINLSPEALEYYGKRS